MHSAEPLLEVTAPVAVAQLVETVLLNQVTLHTTLASKAARYVLAADGRQLVDFAFRRTHGVEAAMAVARGSALVGFAATSNVEAARRYGLEVAGTMAHSFVEAFPTEGAAFRAFAEDHPNRTTFLVDTYDTLRGVRAAIETIRGLGLDGTLGVRLDSGDLDALARGARALLDEAGLEQARIFASGGLDELEVHELVRAGAPVDAFGIGTQMGVSADAPYVDSVYKLVEYDGRAVMKLSSEKVTPSRTQAGVARGRRRGTRRPAGAARRDGARRRLPDARAGDEGGAQARAGTAARRRSRPLRARPRPRAREGEAARASGARGADDERRLARAHRSHARRGGDALGRNGVSERRRRWPWIVAGAVVALVAVFYLGGGFYFSNVLDERALDGEAMRAATADLDPDVEVVRIDDPDGLPPILVLRSLEDDLGVTADGVQGLRWSDGYGRLDGIQAFGDGSLEGRFTLVEGGAPLPGTPAELDVRAYPAEPADSGLGLQAITVEGPLGDYPAWLGTADGETWAIVVHGNSLSAADGLRAVPILTEAGFPALVATYRNDPGAPADPSGKLRYGLTEWQDLEAMVRYALEQGSAGIVLDGYSMGGGIVMAFLQRSSLAAEVRGVILDAPMLDFSTTVDDNASRETLPIVGAPLPSSLTSVAKWMASLRFGVDWPALDYLADTSRYDVPFLVFHGTADTTVPIGTSRRFAALLPERVDLVECDGAEHIGCWNLNPEGYAARTWTFLASTDRCRLCGPPTSA